MASKRRNEGPCLAGQQTLDRTKLAQAKLAGVQYPSGSGVLGSNRRAETQALIEKLPQAMRNTKWPVASHHMEIWLNGGPFEPKWTEKGRPIVLIDWNWYERFSVAQRALVRLREIVQGWASEGKPTLPLTGLLEGTKICAIEPALRRYGRVSFAHCEPPDALRQVEKENGPLYLGALAVKAEELSDLGGAIGNHALRLYATGEAVLLPTPTLIVDNVWVRVFDSYDFDDAELFGLPRPQLLGVWSPKGVDVWGYLPGLLAEMGHEPKEPRRLFGLRRLLMNSDFRDYRRAIGKGTDYFGISVLRPMEWGRQLRVRLVQ